ncbi:MULTISPECIES: aldo/keto reductase [Niastella]|uniref:Aldo/keto reductase n=1 Tax=Niastella soli TaxID=2821487 RepID=A0ABS3YZZ7_9BACT|nr:aldo/keto reductase [Niastella soli]MBO9203494.1 aldo/keto reductase [Niastella soli]
MEYTTLGNTGLIVSKLAFGAMTFGDDTSIKAVYKVDQQLAQAMVDRSLEAGINFFDTADGYANGQSEIMLGKLLAPHRHEVIISTKVGFRTGNPVTQAGLSKKHILFSCEQSLKRLNTDYIDLYILHKEDPFTPLEETLAALNSLVESGKVRYVGYSNWSAWKAALAYQLQKDNGWATFCNGQMNYTLVGRDVEYDVAPFMQHAGIGMTIWGPLAGGFLSGKYTRENLKDPNNRLSGFDLLPFDKEHGFKVVDVLKELAVEYQASVAQIALAWLLSKPVVASVLIGATKMHQLEDNLGAIKIKLNAAQIEQLDTLTKPANLYPHWFNQNLLDPVQKEIFHSK